ncbi:MAG: exopolysaccharide biosynthesis protein [Rhizomicrobium sp.]
MSSFEQDIEDNPAASAVLERLLAVLPNDRVSLGWFHDELPEHSFEMIAFILALIGVLPGASVMIGLAMVVPATGMMLSNGVRLPSVMAERSISASQARYVIARAIPLLRSWEAADRRPHQRIWKLARPAVGLLALLLGMTLLVPVPLSNVLPALAIAGLALASFEGSFTLLCISAFAGASSLAVTGATLIAASQAFANVWH